MVIWGTPSSWEQRRMSWGCLDRVACGGEPSAIDDHRRAVDEVSVVGGQIEGQAGDFNWPAPALGRCPQDLGFGIRQGVGTTFRHGEPGQGGAGADCVDADAELAVVECELAG